MAGSSDLIQGVVPIDFPYNYRVGTYIERFLNGFGEKKILGVKCPSCSKVVVPPRMTCGACNTHMEEWEEVGPEGTLENFTIGHVRLVRGEVQEADSPYVVGMIHLDGADSLFLGYVEGVEPSAVKEGIRVKAVWKEAPEGDYGDLVHFEAL